MRIQSTILKLVALALASTACQPPAQEAGPLSEEDVAAIRNEMQAHVELVLAGDPAAIAAMYTEDGVQMPPNAPAVQGRAAIQEFFAGFPTTTEYVQSIVDADGREGIAYTRSDYSSTFMVEGRPVTDRGKTLAVWKKQPDGSWLVAVAIWNSDLPLLEQSAESEM
jgi:ketosteroid isomerase-like protein